MDIEIPISEKKFLISRSGLNYCENYPLLKDL